ncbi:VCBS repeat-containing protein [Streptomyces sp. NPDC002688]|uniref:FG-GAP repeat domain-containing protein n=1 Tax=Streptomyces sp. NPDC002688 TaxID=3154423 RepID=UPI0033211520
MFSDWGASSNAIVGVGDITGDGKNDLVERDTSGNVYRNAGTGTGSFGSRVKIAGGRQGYKGLFWPTWSLRWRMSCPRRGNRWGHDR